MKMNLDRAQRDLVSRALVAYANMARNASQQQSPSALAFGDEHQRAMLVEAHDADMLGARFSQALSAELAFARGVAPSVDAGALDQLAEAWLADGATPDRVATMLAAGGMRRFCELGYSLADVQRWAAEAWTKAGGCP
jgi:hypothetical protein